MDSSVNTLPTRQRVTVALATFFVVELDVDPETEVPEEEAAAYLELIKKRAWLSSAPFTFDTPAPGETLETTTFPGLRLSEALGELMP